MAIAKIHAIKSTLNKAINYITNPEKTILADGTQLVSSFGCATETAAVEFKLTDNLAKEIKGDYSKTGGADNLAYHLVQSFALNDKEKLTPEKMHELGKEFADKFLDGKHEYVIATHIDKDHIHNHIIFNATSFVDYKKFRSQPFKTIAKIREISDQVCQENGLSVLPAVGIGKSYKEWQLNKEGRLTWKDTIKNKIDEVVPRVTSFAEFVTEMKAAGFEVKDGTHIAFRCPEQERFVRGKRIGEDYSKSKIIERISTERENNNKLNIAIKKELIFKTLTDGYLINVPNKDYIVYLDAATAKLENNQIVAMLTAAEYSILNKRLTPAGKITAEQLIESFTVTETREIGTDGKGEIPLSEYLQIRQQARKDMLQQAANAIAYSRTEGVVYYSDFEHRIQELKSQSRDTKKTLKELDNTVSDIKKIGKLLITYQKYLPVHQELEKLKFAKFTRSKFESKHQLDLASFRYADESLRALGIEPATLSKEELVDQIKNNEKVIRKFEKQVDSITERIDKLGNAQAVIDNFISSRDEVQHVVERANKKKTESLNL